MISFEMRRFCGEIRYYICYRLYNKMSHEQNRVISILRNTYYTGGCVCFQKHNNILNR